MQPREDELLDIITELCSVNEYSHFDISIRSVDGEFIEYLCFEGAIYPLDELEMTIHEIEWLERIEKISLIHKFRFKELKSDEVSRTTYGLFVPTKGPVHYQDVSSTKWTPITVISLISGTSICVYAIFMLIQRINIVGYDTRYGGGYNYFKLSPYGVMFIGVFLLLMGVINMPKSKKK